MCHILFLLPFVALLLFFLLPPGQAIFLSIPLFLIFLWLAWVTWNDMRRPVPTGIEGLMGGKAQVVSKTGNGAKVLLRGELWDAVSDDEFTVGENVKVTRLEGMKLVVRKEVHSRES
jgi:membrane-bound serine protease (ClpP class)